MPNLLTTSFLIRLKIYNNLQITEPVVKKTCNEDIGTVHSIEVLKTIFGYFRMNHLGLL